MSISYLPVLQVRNGCVLKYLQYQYDYRPPPKKSIIENLQETGISTYSGEVKSAAARRLQSTIDVIIQTSRVKMIKRPNGKMFPFRLAFVTLTVPGKIQKVKDVQKVFSSFTAWLRYTRTSYVWKAEFQKRGQLHYHLIVNRYLEWKEISKAWNSRLKKAKMLQEYAAEHGHFNPNSTDVRSVRMDKSKNMAKYLAKYIAKDLENSKGQKIGKWWGASRNLNSKRFVFEGDYAELDKLEKCKKIEGDQYVIYQVNPISIMSKGTKANYQRWKKNVRENVIAKPVIIKTPIKKANGVVKDEVKRQMYLF